MGKLIIIAGNGKEGYSGDGGPAKDASLSSPLAIALDPSGNIFIADSNNNLVRKIDADGIITTAAGYIESKYEKNLKTCGKFGKPKLEKRGFGEEEKDLTTSLSLDHPDSIAIDKEENLYISNSGNHTIVQINNGNVSLYAGTGEKGFSEDGISPLSAQLDIPAALATDHLGDLYFNDSENFRIRKVDGRTKTIITVAGNGGLGYSGDNGPAIYASLNMPMSLCFDQMGNLYIADSGNHRIRMVDMATGIIMTVAGNGEAGYSGDGGKATSCNLNFPEGVAVDNEGNIYIADSGNNRIRMAERRSGIIRTIVGGDALKEQLDHPSGLAVDPNRGLYIADTFNNRVLLYTA